MKIGEIVIYLIRISTYSREFVASVADEHTSFSNGTISNSHTFDEFWSIRSHSNSEKANHFQRRNAQKPERVTKRERSNWEINEDYQVINMSKCNKLMFKKTQLSLFLFSFNIFKVSILSLSFFGLKTEERERIGAHMIYPSNPHGFSKPFSIIFWLL